jgi:hypothetical protein
MFAVLSRTYIELCSSCVSISVYASCFPSLSEIASWHSFAFRYPPLPPELATGTWPGEDDHLESDELQLRIPNLSFMVDQHPSP